MDVLLLGVGKELLAGKERVTFDLVDRGDRSGALDDCLKLEKNKILAEIIKR